MDTPDRSSEQQQTSVQNNEGAVSVWCHICSGTSTAIKNILNEYECVICRETFVEEVDQGVEEFLEGGEESVPLLSARDSNSSAALSASTASGVESNSSNVQSSNLSTSLQVDHTTIVNHVLERVLGLNTPIATRGQPMTVLSTDVNGARRPVGIVISRQSAMNVGGLSGLDGTNAGLFNLLSSLTQIRQSSPGFDSRDALNNAQFEQFLHHVLMNETSHAGAPPATDEMVAALEKLVVDGDVELSTLGECSISQEAFDVGDTIIALPCGHRYKEEPILHWLKMHRTCPVCRVDISN